MLHIIFSTRLKDKKNEQYLSTKIIEKLFKERKETKEASFSRRRINKSRDITFTYYTKNRKLQ